MSVFWRLVVWTNFETIVYTFECLKCLKSYNFNNCKIKLVVCRIIFVYRRNRVWYKYLYCIWYKYTLLKIHKLVTRPIHFHQKCKNKRLQNHHIKFKISSVEFLSWQKNFKLDSNRVIQSYISRLKWFEMIWKFSQSRKISKK